MTCSSGSFFVSHTMRLSLNTLYRTGWQQYVNVFMSMLQKVDLLMGLFFFISLSLFRFLFTFFNQMQQHPYYKSKSHYFSSSSREPSRHASTRDSGSHIGDWLAREEALLEGMEADITERLPPTRTTTDSIQQVCRDMCPVFHVFAVLLTWHLVCIAVYSS